VEYLSELSLPFGRQIEIKEAVVLGQLSSDGTTVTTESHTVVGIELAGIECQIRQESKDEIYSVISIIGPSNNTIVSRRFPASGTIDMGPDGMRISSMRVPLISEAVVQDFYVWASLVENDSGDIDVIARNITDKVADVANATVGALTGASAEGVANSESFKENMVLLGYLTTFWEWEITLTMRSPSSYLGVTLTLGLQLFDLT